MTTPALVCAGLELVLTRYLRLEPEVLAECERLRGKLIRLRVESLDWDFNLFPHGAGVQVMAQAEQPADVTVSGSLTVLLRQVWSVASGEGGVPAGLTLEGDTELLTRFNKLLARVGFDPEELAAKFVGDGAAHRLTEGLRVLFNWGRQTASTLSLDTAEYLREETGDLAHRADVENWMDDVDRLRERTDRFEAKLQRLEKRMSPAAHGP